MQLHEGEQAALVEEGLSEGIVHMAGSGIPPGAMSVIGGLPHARSSSSPLCMSRAARVRPFSSTACQPFAGRCRRLLWPLLASAAPSRRLTHSAASTIRHAGGRTADLPGKTRDLRSIHPPHIRQHPPDDIGLQVFMPPRPGAGASMRFLFVGPELCLQLPSNPVSRRRSCCSANGSRHQGP